MKYTPRYVFWSADGVRYGRIKSFATPEDFLRRIYAVTPEEDSDHAFCEDWKAEHPLDAFLVREAPRVHRHCVRFAFFEGGGYTWMMGY